MTIYTPELVRQHQAHIARRQKLFTPKPRPAEIVELAPPVISAQKVSAKAWDNDRPSWTWVNMSFDSHVKVWERITAIKAAAENEEIKQLEADFMTVVKRPVREIVFETLKSFPGVSWSDVTGIHRKRFIVKARQNCIYDLYTERKDLSYPLIGRIFGGRDHTTILYTVNKIRAEREAASEI